MISRFFIDRPIFAAVISIVITLVGAIALYFLPIAQYPRITPPGVVVTISYPGASAKVVADTVAAPIEQQVNGVPGMLYMSSQMGNDGSYTLSVTFDIGVDLNTALVMVQNRVALAMKQLPTEVQNQGITIRKKTPDILMIVNFYSPDGRFDDIFLSNYATINCKDELLRVPGVSDISYQGQRDYSIRAWLDPQKMAARNITAVDVANAVRAQNIDAPSGQVGEPPEAPQPTLSIADRRVGPADDTGRIRGHYHQSEPDACGAAGCGATSPGRHGQFGERADPRRDAIRSRERAAHRRSDAGDEFDGQYVFDHLNHFDDRRRCDHARGRRDDDGRNHDGIDHCRARRVDGRRRHGARRGNHRRRGHDGRHGDFRQHNGRGVDDRHDRRLRSHGPYRYVGNQSRLDAHSGTSVHRHRQASRRGPP